MHEAVSRPVSVAVVMLHPKCNMTCTFCVTEDGFDEMQFDEAVALLDHLAGAGVSSVVLGGGEPFVWPGGVVRLAAEVRARGMSVQVGTNGIDLPEGFADLDCFDRWVIPLESVDPGPHQEMRRYRGQHHALILSRLDELQRAGRSITVSTVLTAVNVVDVLGVARFLREYHAVGENVHAWHLYQFIPQGRGGARNSEALTIPEDAYLEACASVKQLDLPFRVYRRSDMYASKTVQFYWSEGGRLVGGGEALPI